MAKAKKEEAVMFDFTDEVKEEPKKTAPKKTAPKKAEPKVEEPVVEKPKAIRNVKSSKFDDKDLIPCKSVTSGGLSFIGISGTKYRFANYGVVEYIAYGDLRREAQSANPTNYLFYPRFIVVDPEFVEEFPKLEEFYSKFYTDEGDFEEILNLPEGQMVEAIEKLPKGCKECLKGIVATKLEDGEIDSVQKIKLLDRVFGTNMLLKIAND